ncbi:phytanoyl-CoA dioxygenase family protein [Dactylosporangium sp. NPDC050688]|uniref:phytanoyl-CoA dioxygenase family protein n=1 Tax=Dactylosporangium sp. NPDC050688 TaxID=3157217 RepID=UPI0033C50C8C
MTPSTVPNSVPLNRTQFTKDGYLVLPEIVPPAMITRLRAEADAALTGMLDTMAHERVTDPRLTWWRLPSGRLYVLKIKSVLDLAATAAVLAAGPLLHQVTTDLLGSAAQLIDSKFMYKQTVDVPAAWTDLPVLGEEVCKHTDAVYYRAKGHDQVVTVALCLDDCTPTTGALKVWPGTHHRDIEMIATQRQGPVVPDNAAPDSHAVALLAPAGSMLVWDSALVHASGPNESGRPRRLLVLGYAATAAAGAGAP